VGEVGIRSPFGPSGARWLFGLLHLEVTRSLHCCLQGLALVDFAREARAALVSLSGSGWAPNSGEAHAEVDDEVGEVVVDIVEEVVEAGR